MRHSGTFPIAILLLSSLALAACPRRSDSSSDSGPATAPAEDSGRTVQCLAETSSGEILYGTVQQVSKVDPGLMMVTDYGVYRVAKGASAARQIAAGLPKASVRGIVLTRSGALVAATSEGIFRSENEGEQWNPATAEPHPVSYGVTVLRSGRLLAATQRGLLASSDDGKTWAAVGEKRGEVNAVIEHPTAGVFAGTDKGVIRSSDGDNPWELVGLTKETVLSLAVDGAGNLLAGTLASDASTGQSSPSQLTIDSMIGWRGGVLRYEPPKTPALDAGSTAPDAGAARAGAGDAGATKQKPGGRDAGVRRDPSDAGSPDAADGAEQSELLDASWRPAGLQNSTIWAMAALPGGGVLAASHTKGLQRWDPGTSTWAPVQGIAQRNPVASLLVASSGEVWAGAVHGLFVSSDRGATFRRATSD